MKRLTISKILTAGTAAGAIVLAAQGLAVAQERGSIQGVINDASGKPVAGAFVKLKNDERRLTFMVMTPRAGPVRGQGPAARSIPRAGRWRGIPERLVRQSAA